MIRWRIRQTQSVGLDSGPVEGAYATACSLAADVQTLLKAIVASPSGRFLTNELQSWLDRITTFGFHLARLDVRQDARQYRTIIDVLLQSTGLAENPSILSEAQRQKLLIDSLRQRLELSSAELSDEAREAISLFTLLHRVMKSFGAQALGGHVISMTNAPSDVFTVLWLWHQTAPNSISDEPQRLACLPVVPLFETIGDLRHGPEILSGMFQVTEYREYVRRLGDRQIAMLGYSDSTKDGG